MAYKGTPTSCFDTPGDPSMMVRLSLDARHVSDHL